MKRRVCVYHSSSGGTQKNGKYLRSIGTRKGRSFSGSVTRSWSSARNSMPVVAP